MPFRLSSFPTGLLSLLGSQNFGENPKTLADDIVSTIDIGDLFRLTKQVSIVGSAAPIVSGVNVPNSLVVPAGEIWFVSAGSMFVNAPAAATGNVTPVYLEGLSTYSLALSDTVSFVASTDRHRAFQFTPFWAQAGSRFALDATSIAGTPGASISLLVSKLRA